MRVSWGPTVKSKPPFGFTQPPAPLLNMFHQDPKSRQSPPARAGTLTVAEAMRHAVAFFQGGNLVEAERLCRFVLSTHSNYFEALHLSGMVAARRGRFEEADQ